MKKLQDLTVDDVIQVYSGQDGKCCCGCSGKHTYNPNLLDLANESHGGLLTESDCNIRTVKMILNKLKKAELDGEKIEDEDEGDFFSFHTPGRETARYRYGRSFGNNGGVRRYPGRLYIVYLKPSEQEILEARLRRLEAKRDQKQANEDALKGAGI
jgi:hypothetical protein